MRMNAGRREHAFTIVEVIVAALIISMVFAGAVYFMIGAGKSQQKTLTRQRMAAAADGIVQKVRADRTWLTAQCKRTGCSLTSPRFQPTPTTGRSSGPDLTAAVRVTPIDSDGDRQGALDQDGVRPDFYRIQVRVALVPGEEREWGDLKPFETVSTVDATALGVATGTLVVQTGETSNQVDDRMPISSVTASGDRVDMRRQPDPCSSPFPITFDEWVNRKPILPLGCNDAIDAARPADPYMGQVDLRGVNNVRFRITRINSDGVSSASRSSATDADGGGPSSNGTYTFSGLPAGSYRIDVNPPAGREPWTTKMIPSNGVASVQANQKAQALVMVRPTQGTGNYRVQFSRQVYIYTLKTETPPPVVSTHTQGGVTIQVTTTYVYLVADGPRKETWGGPAWTGLLAIEPKPFDRYRPSGNGVGAAAQTTLPVYWDGVDLRRVPRSHPNHGGWFAFADLATGLHSSPHQQEEPTRLPAEEVGLWGAFDADDRAYGWNGRREQSCDASLTPGGRCGNFAWMSHLPRSLGRPNSAIHYYSPQGECYLDSTVAQVPIPGGRRLQNGPGRPERCSRDFLYKNWRTGTVTPIPNFLPDKNGNGGGRMVLSMSQTSRCIANCGISSTGGSSSGIAPEPTSSGNATVGSRSGPPPQTNNDIPPVSVTNLISTPGGGTTTRTNTIGAAPAISAPAASP